MTEPKQYFFERIDSLDTGARAALRREAGNLLRQADGKAITTFYGCLPQSTESGQEDRWFAVACLRCLWDHGPETGRPLEQILAELIRSEVLSDSTKHRVELLLDTGWEADGYMLIKLARLVKLVRQKSDKAMIDFPSLLDDLIFWNAESRSVQRKWARTVFSNISTIETEE